MTDRESSSEREYHQRQADEEAGGYILGNLEAILSYYGAKNVRELGHRLYKGYDCGPHLSVRLHDGTWRHSEQLSGVENGNVRSLLVGSIVEGSDASVNGEEFDLLREDETEKVVADFNEGVDAVNEEACRLWDEANKKES